MKLFIRSYPVLAVLACLASAPLLLAAEPSAPVVVQQTLLQKLNMPTIYILVVCSMLIVWLVTDGYVRTAPKQVMPVATLEALRTFFRAGDYHGAFDYCRAHPSLLPNVVGAGLRHASEGKTATEDAVITAVMGENARFQNKIAYLSVIGVIAPMIGLVGTVLGMIEAFAAMGQAGAADPSKLSGAIGKVLYATAGGLVVAIPAFVFYYLLRNRTAQAIHHLQEEVAELFRRFPYEDLTAVEFAGGQPCAARPKWLRSTVSDGVGVAGVADPGPVSSAQSLRSPGSATPATTNPAAS
ncbi:MAG TPA: MotA/TolQ/ExbB proton channel family protein [Opitutaceae bacterium]